MPRKALPRLRTVTIKGKEFHQVSIPQPGGGRRLRTFKSADDAKKFHAAVQDEMSRLALYRLEEARCYVHGEVQVKIKGKCPSDQSTAVPLQILSRSRRLILCKPSGGRELADPFDWEVSQAWQDRAKIVANRDLKPPGGFDYRDNRCNLALSGSVWSAGSCARQMLICGSLGTLVL